VSVGCYAARKAQAPEFFTTGMNGDPNLESQHIQH